MKGSRVQAVVNELHGEKIDIVPWSENQHEFVSRALAPAKVSSLRFNESESTVLAIVEDDQLSLAIGRDGQNVRLASRLTGWKIDLTTVRETERRDKLEQKLQMDISEMYGVTPRLSGMLKNIGILTVQKLYKTPLDELLDVDGIGPKTAEKLKATAAETNEELNRVLEELLEKEKEEEAAKKQLFDDEVFASEEKEEEAKLTEEQLFGSLDEDEDGGEEEESAADETGDEDEDGGEEEESAADETGDEDEDEDEEEESAADGDEDESGVDEAEDGEPEADETGDEAEPSAETEETGDAAPADEAGEDESDEDKKND